MTENQNRFYIFLLSHTTKEKIYIRRLEVSKRLLHTSVVSLFLFLGVSSLTVTGFIRNDAFSFIAEAAENSTADAADAAQSVLPVSPFSARNEIDYSRPQSNDEFSMNSGGPSDYRIAVTDSTLEEKEIERKLRAIESGSSPDFLPTIWAHLGEINNEFGFRRNPFGGRSYEFHSGMDIDGDQGDMVVAPANGTIISAGWQGGYGRMIEIDHGNGLTTRYGHLSRLGVREGEKVQRGQLMGLVGSTGRSTGPHLHYELRLDKKPINPRRFLPPEPTKARN